MIKMLMQIERHLLLHIFGYDLDSSVSVENVAVTILNYYDVECTKINLYHVIKIIMYMINDKILYYNPELGELYLSSKLRHLLSV
jgi:hypothetical protein